MEQPLLQPLVRHLRIHRRRVVAEHDEFDALQSHHPVDLRPAAVVADAHPHDRALVLPDVEAEVAGQEIALLQMLEGAGRVVFGMAGQMHLAVLADDLALAVRQDRGVEVLSLGGQLGIAEGDGDAVVPRLGEQRLGRPVRHLALEPLVDLGLVLHVPAREEGGERQLREDDEAAALRPRLLQQRQHALHHGLAAVGLLDRAHLGAADDDLSHGVLPDLDRWTSERQPAFEAADQPHQRP